MKKKKEHLIKFVEKDSIAEELEIQVNDRLLAINGTEIQDVFDYQYLIQDSFLEVLIEKPDGEQWILEIDKEPEEDLGIQFEEGLMDAYKSCRNKCIFCFIDQMPKGMRDTLYFKDDDSRLSFLQGNYVTLTNMSEEDVERICKYHLSPINISFQTMNPKLRCQMLNNRFAGDALRHVERFMEAGIEMNGQIVLCKGINDGDELRFSIEKLLAYRPNLMSVSVVPVGISKYREGLFPLEPFTKEDAEATIDLIEEYQKTCFEEFGLHFVHASDEWYILAERELPEEERYDGYLQLENGVGMLRLLLTEFEEELQKRGADNNGRKLSVKRKVSIATGKLAFPYIRRMANQLEETYEDLDIRVYEITNHFFGESITVSGLITATDLMQQLRDKELGETLYLPENMLRSGEDVFLDDYHVADVEKALQVPIDIVKSSGYEFVKAMIGG